MTSSSLLMSLALRLTQVGLASEYILDNMHMILHPGFLALRRPQERACQHCDVTRLPTRVPYSTWIVRTTSIAIQYIVLFRYQRCC